jgi:hypothetical protein
MSATSRIGADCGRLQPHGFGLLLQSHAQADLADDSGLPPRNHPLSDLAVASVAWDVPLKGERAPERRPVAATQAGLDAGRQQVDCETTPGAPLRLIYRRESAGAGCPCRPTQADHRLLPLVSSPCPWPATATTRAHPGA